MLEAAEREAAGEGTCANLIGRWISGEPIKTGLVRTRDFDWLSLNVVAVLTESFGSQKGVEAGRRRSS